MDELRRRLADLDRVAVPDHWPEVQRRAWARPEDFEPAAPTLAPRTRWIGPRRSAEGSHRMFTPVRVLGVGLMLLVSASLLAVSFSSPGTWPGQHAGAPGSSPGTSATALPQAPVAGSAIAWDTGCVQLTAESLRIEPATVEGQASPVFTAADSSVDLSSDPGSDTYRTLEAIWQEHGSEMRLFLYFSADADSWWVRELRTYDGQPIPDWVTYPGPLFETPLGETFRGDVALESAERSVPSAIEIKGLVLSVPGFGPGSGPARCLTSGGPLNAQSEADTEAGPPQPIGSEADATPAARPAGSPLPTGK